MSRWTIEEPTTLDFDGVVALKVTLVAGAISVLASDERPAMQITKVAGPPLIVSHEAGMLEITQESLLDGMLRWLRSQECSADITVTVPRDCPVRLNLVTADAVVTAISATTSIKSGAGDVTLDGVTGRIDANTVSGAVEAQGLGGSVTFTSVSGDLSLAGGSVDRLTARTVSGRVAADIELSGERQVQINTVSGEVALRLSASTSAQVDLRSVTGRVDSSFTGLDRDVRPAVRSLTGTLADGTGRLSVTTISGGVSLLSRPDEVRDRDTPVTETPVTKTPTADAPVTGDPLADAPGTGRPDPKDSEDR